MADEIRNQNVIETSRNADGSWTARIAGEGGPSHTDAGPVAAISGLLTTLHWGGYQFDPSWKPAASPATPVNPPAA